MKTECAAGIQTPSLDCKHEYKEGLSGMFAKARIPLIAAVAIYYALVNGVSYTALDNTACVTFKLNSVEERNNFGAACTPSTWSRACSQHCGVL